MVMTVKAPRGQVIARPMSGEFTEVCDQQRCLPGDRMMVCNPRNVVRCRVAFGQYRLD